MSVWLLHQSLIPSPASPEHKNQTVQKRIKNSSTRRLGAPLLTSNLKSAYAPSCKVFTLEPPGGQGTKWEGMRGFPRILLCAVTSSLGMQALFQKLCENDGFGVFLKFDKRWCYPELN